ncbi:MAG: hypothetical protein U1C49_00690 [Candidatus Andersenbacteria bacterium]|nr:hypothetical protein [Candidatus Andersenbacteria bacterium]
MSKEFYRDIKIIKFCKACGKEYRPPRYSWRAYLGLCHWCLGSYYKIWYKERYLPYFKRQTEEKQKELKKNKYIYWKEWVTKNETKRKKQALASYHKNKEKHKTRKHRATRPRSPLQKV